MAKPSQQPKQTLNLSWAKETELLSLSLQLKPLKDLSLPTHYTTQLHAWFLDQVRRLDPTLSAYLHDGQSEKPFTLSQLTGIIQSQGRSQLFTTDETYQWTLTALSRPVVEWMRQWLQTPPTEINLRAGTFAIAQYALSQPPTTYRKLAKLPVLEPPTLTLSFFSPTSFRRKGHHFPLPHPFNLFHSYLRRWNDFSSQPIDQTHFLDWIDTSVVILRHHLRSHKVNAGKSGSVTGFTGSVQFGLTPKALQQAEFVKIFIALGQLAPYCGTGHKTTFGLGQTRLGWREEEPNVSPPSLETILSNRIATLADLFLSQRKRTGGDRASSIAQTWATILARREIGEGLRAIALDLGMPYETVKTYAKLARKAIH